MLLDFVRYPGGREGRIISECQIKKRLTQNPRINALSARQAPSSPEGLESQQGREDQDRCGWGLFSVSQTLGILGNSLYSQSLEYHNFSLPVYCYYLPSPKYIKSSLAS